MKRHPTRNRVSSGRIEHVQNALRSEHSESADSEHPEFSQSQAQRISEDHKFIELGRSEGLADSEIFRMLKSYRSVRQEMPPEITRRISEHGTAHPHKKIRHYDEGGY
jgi:hypothetical protein